MKNDESFWDLKNQTIVSFSILCLTALNKIDEACALVTQMIEQYPQTADLLIIRARLYFKEKTKVKIRLFSLFKRKDFEVFQSIVRSLEQRSKHSKSLE